MTSPVFSCRIQVAQMDGGTGGIWALLLVCVFLMAPPLAAGAWLIEREDVFGALGVVLSIALTLVMCLVGLLVWAWLDARWRTWRGKPPLFSAMTQVDIDERGVAVETLGHIEWIDVLAIEGIPDSSSCLVLHTRPFEKLMLSAPVDALAEVISHYLAKKNVPTVAAAGSQVLQLRAVVFRWPRFIAWIWAGYAVAGALGLVLLQHASDAGFFKTLVALGVLVPLSAWLVWMIPLAQLDVLAPSRVRAFELDDAALRSTDDAVRIDLRRARIDLRSVSGLGYEFSFFSVRPDKGARLDLILADDDRRALRDVLEHRGLMQQRA